MKMHENAHLLLGWKKKESLDRKVIPQPARTIFFSFQKLLSS
jgi:hypothetical protein